MCKKQQCKQIFGMEEFEKFVIHKKEQKNIYLLLFGIFFKNVLIITEIKKT